MLLGRGRRHPLSKKIKKPETLDAGEMAESFGPYFKHVREQQGVSLDQLGKRTRIQTVYLGALEKEMFAELPAQVFAKGFVRTYARCLGVDEKDALQRFAEASRSFYQQDQEEQERLHLQKERENKGRKNRHLVILITATLLIGLAFLLPREHQTVRSVQKKTAEETGSPTVSTPRSPSSPRNLSASLPSVPPKSNGQTVAPSSTQPPITKRSIQEGPGVTEKSPGVTGAVPLQPLLLELEATDMTWVVVQSDEDAPHEALLQPGQKASWHASKQFILTLGNAGGVHIQLNGQPRGPFGQSKEVVRNIVLTPSIP